MQTVAKNASGRIGAADAARPARRRPLAPKREADSATPVRARRNQRCRQDEHRRRDARAVAPRAITTPTRSRRPCWPRSPAGRPGLCDRRCRSRASDCSNGRSGRLVIAETTLVATPSPLAHRRGVRRLGCGFRTSDSTVPRHTSRGCGTASCGRPRHPRGRYPAAWRPQAEPIQLLPALTELRVYDNSADAIRRPVRRRIAVLVLHVDRGRIVGPPDLASTPEWAKPIVAAALSL